jgi:tetratricopeptide (TPR) repeat protein
MVPGDDPTSAGSLAAARAALERKDLRGAVRLLASVLGEDPNRADALSVLDEVIAAAADPLELVPSDDLPLPSGLQAVRAYILADQGRVPEGVDRLLEVIAARPDVLYIDWLLGWLQRPEAAGRLDVEPLTGLVSSLLEQYPALTAPHGGGRDTLARMPLFVQLVRRTQPADIPFLMVSAALLCRLGHLDEALRLAREAYEREPGLPTAMALGGTHAARNELDQALSAYRDAQAHEPGDFSARLSMADLLVHHGRLAEAQELYAEILEREPNHEGALPSSYFLRFAAAGEAGWRDKLLALAEEQPDNERAQRLAYQATPYVGYLPDPPDVTANLQRLAGTGPDDAAAASRYALPYLEAPSNFVAFAWLHKLDVTVARIKKPDPRLPRGRVDFLLWRYEGTRPRVAVAPPAPAVAEAVAQLAAQPYHLDAWWGQARRLAQQLGPARVEDLLATMVYPPGVGGVDRPAAWVFRVQVAAALVIAHLDSGWEDSVRGRALLSLVNGPMDWTVDAALVALAALARAEDDCAPAIAEQFRALRAGLSADSALSFVPALLWNSLRLPDVTDEERDALRQQVRQWQDARQAEHHYRQALAHADRGDLERAFAELTETLRLAPDNADAFRERAALALRRSDAPQAAADFSEAIRLQPDMAAAHLGRGQAHLRLGRFEQAIADFTAATRLAPRDWQAWYRRGLAHAARKEPARAIEDFSEVINLKPAQAEAYQQRALAFTQLGQYDRAREDYTAQIRLNPRSPLAHNARARLHRRQGNHAAAIADHLEASRLDEGNANTHAALAWIWATCPDAALRDGARAVAAAENACALGGWKSAYCLDVLAAARAECGRFDEAVRRAQQAVELALEAERPAYREHLEAFRQGRPWREP